MMLIFSAMFILIKLALLFNLIHYSSNAKSKMFFLNSGLDPWRYWIFTFFAHFLIMRILLGFLVFFSEYVESKIMLLILLSVQICSLLIHGIQIYNRIYLHMQIVVFREVNLTISAMVIAYVSIKNNQKIVPGLLISFLNISFACLFLLTVLIDLVYKIAVWIYKKWCFK